MSKSIVDVIKHANFQFYRAHPVGVLEKQAIDNKHMHKYKFDFEYLTFNTLNDMGLQNNLFRKK